MITFKQYLNEAVYKGSRLQTITAPKAISLMEENCIGYLNRLKGETRFIYRGGSGGAYPALSLGDSNNATPRISANTENYYTLWMDNHPDWSKFPKRSQSFICSENEGVSEGFGEVYWVIPYDDAHIEIVPSDDLWGAFDISDTADLNSFINHLHDIFKKSGKSSPKTYEDLVKTLKKITYDDIDVSLGLPAKSIKAIMDKTNTRDLYQLFQKIINPKHFIQLRAKQYSNTGNKYELAIQGKAIFIPIIQDKQHPTLDAFFKELNIKVPYHA